ncbi:MAG: DUF3791 domain-containing protein [Anaerovoracaceae bacterium]
MSKSLTGAEVADIFDKNGVVDFLLSGYDMLHTQSMEYVINEIHEYLRNRGHKV